MFFHHIPHRPARGSERSSEPLPGMGQTPSLSLQWRLIAGQYSRLHHLSRLPPVSSQIQEILSPDHFPQLAISCSTTAASVDPSEMSAANFDYATLLASLSLHLHKHTAAYNKKLIDSIW